MATGTLKKTNMLATATYMTMMIQTENKSRRTPAEHRLRIRILLTLKVPKIHEFLRILKLSILKFIKFKLSHSSPPSSNKFFVANTPLNFWIKSSVMSTVQNSLTLQQFSMIMSSLLQSPRIACSFVVLLSVRIWVLDCPLFPFNGCLSVIDCQLLCEFENFAVISDAIKRIFTKFYEFSKVRKIREFLRILNTELTNSQSMPQSTHQQVDSNSNTMTR